VERTCLTKPDMERLPAIRQPISQIGKKAEEEHKAQQCEHRHP